MFKFMKSKKGFTLVELMIVVVIMAILVAVAVPIYNAVTENARKKTCSSNRRNIVSQITNNAMSDPEILAAGVATATEAAPITFTITTDAAGEDVASYTNITNAFVAEADFTNLFNSENKPICPVASGELTVSMYPTVAGDVTSLDVTVDCTGEADHDENAAA